MRVIFTRHGESTGNAGIPSFDLSQMALTPTGYAQAENVAVSWQEPPALIAVSPYLRTQLTAQPTIDRFPTVPVEVLPMEEFTYLEPDRWNGTSRQERLPYVEAYWAKADPKYCDGPGAESFDCLLGRVGVTLMRLEWLPSDALVYAFGHGQFMQALRVSLLFPSWTAQQQMAHFWAFNEAHPIQNCDQFEIDYQDGVWRTLGVADEVGTT